MWFRKKTNNSFLFLLKRFTNIENDKEDQPYTDTCKCGHGDFQHAWGMWIFWIRHQNCYHCQCQKFKNIGKMGFKARYAFLKQMPFLNISPSKELDKLLKDNGF